MLTLILSLLSGACAVDPGPPLAPVHDAAARSLELVDARPAAEGPDRLHLIWTDGSLDDSLQVRLWRVRDPWMEVCVWAAPKDSHLRDLLLEALVPDAEPRADLVEELHASLDPVLGTIPVVVLRHDGYRWCSWRVKDVEEHGRGWVGWNASSSALVDHLDVATTCEGLLPTGEWVGHALDKGTLRVDEERGDRRLARHYVQLDGEARQVGCALRLDGEGRLTAVTQGPPVALTEDPYLGLDLDGMEASDDLWHIAWDRRGELVAGSTRPVQQTRTLPLDGELVELVPHARHFVTLAAPAGLPPFEAGAPLDEPPAWVGLPRVLHAEEPFFTAPEFLGDLAALQAVRAEQEQRRRTEEREAGGASAARRVGLLALALGLLGAGGLLLRRSRAVTHG